VALCLPSDWRESDVDCLHALGSWCLHRHRQDWAAFLSSLKLRLYSKKVAELKSAVQARRGCRQLTSVC
jgi:hypothetical protein